MSRLPSKFAPVVYGIIQVAITTAVATAIAVFQSTGLAAASLSVWAAAGAAAGGVMLPVVIVLSPLVRRLVSAITEEGPH
jgi:hypothetical protein